MALRAALGVNTILLTSGLSGRIIRPEFGLSEEQFPNRNAAPPEAKGPRFLGTNPSEKIQRQCSVTSPFATLRTFATERLPMRVRAALLRRPGESDLSAYAEGREIMIQSYRLAKRTILLAALVVATAWAWPSFAQPTWLPPITPATPNGFPQYGGDGSQSAAYDATHDRLIVFGGVSPFDNGAVSHDTWVLFNASGAGGTPTWTQLHTTNDPPGRMRHSAVYDCVTNRMIVFGGTTANGGGAFLSDVWVLTNANGLNGSSSPWLQRTPTGGPPDGRSQNGAVYDVSSNAMAIFFGSDPAGTQTWSDVWVLHGANDITNQPTWQIASQSGDVPSGRRHFATAYDQSSRLVTIFGGCCGYSNAAFVGVLDLSTPSVAWTALTPGGTTPPAGDVTTFGYDPGSNGLAVLDIVPGDGTNGTWLLSDANAKGGTDAWTNIIPGTTPGVPPHGFPVGSGYNPNSKILVDALNIVQNNTQVPQVWILKDADASTTGLLSFPLLNKTAMTAAINTVFDHSSVGNYCANPNQASRAVTAYTGERGFPPYFGTYVSFTCSITGTSNKLYAFGNGSGKPFTINGNYTGAGTPNFLNYEGHPGYDYRTTDQNQDGTLCSTYPQPCNSTGKTPVLAAADATVVCVLGVVATGYTCNETTNGAKFGEVKIDHGNGYSTVYLHLSKPLVNLGDRVVTGQQIGISGDAGVKKIPHLHFEVRRNDLNVPVDPYGWEGCSPDPYTRAVNINLWK